MTRPARLHHAPLAAGPLRLGGPAHRYLARVLRLPVGARITLFDGAGHEASATITTIDDEAGALDVAVDAPAAAVLATPGLELTLLCALLKGDKLELVIQKATELGATRIVPILTSRAVVRLDGVRAGQRTIRWRSIAAEAARQSGRADVPEVTEPLALEDALASSSPAGPRLFVDEEARDRPLARALDGDAPAVTVAIGPEGGWSDEERAAAARAGFTPVGLGPRTLRAETAAIAAVTVVAHRLGDLGR